MDSHATGQPTGQPADIDRLRLPARQESLPPLRALALAWAGQAGLAQDAVQRLDLVLEEVLMNVFFHAYRHHASPAELGDVELALVPFRQGDPPGRLSLTLTDWGVAFDPLAPQDPGLAASLTANLGAGLDERAPGGLGLFLLRTLAKGSYARQGRANVLTLTFGP